MGHKKTVTVVVSRERLVAKKKRDGRSMYDASAKRLLIDACLVPGVSIAGMALAHGVNANVLRKWLTRERALRRGPTTQAPHQGVQRTTVSAQAKLLPVSIGESLPTSPIVVAPPRATFAIEIGGARIVVESATIDRAALRAVIDCLRESETR